MSRTMDIPTAGVEADGRPWRWTIDTAFLVAITAVWALTALVVDPIGEFPLNDDWAYNLPVKWLVETGRLRVTDQGAMTLVTQSLLGGAVALIGGFSFTLLRILTLVVGAFGLAGAYLLGREVGLPRRLAMALTLIFLVNPIYISLGASFMTDVYFWSLAMFTTYLLLRGTIRGQTGFLWAGWAAALALVLLRQVGLAIPMALVLTIPIRGGTTRSWLVHYVIPTALLIIVVAAYPRVMQATIGLAYNYGYTQENFAGVVSKILHMKLGAWKFLLYAIGCGLMHLGWWMLPLLLILPSPAKADTSPRRRALMEFVPIVAAIALTVLLAVRDGLMPVGSLGCILIDLGTGPRMLGEFPGASPAFWVAFTAFSAYGAAAIVLRLVIAFQGIVVETIATRDPRPHWLAAFWWLVLAAYNVPFGYFGPWFDRYLFLEMSLVGLLIAGDAIRRGGVSWRPSALRWGIASTLGLLYLAFGAVTTHDYLAWNRARWDLAQTVMRDNGLFPADLNGGFEFNEYYSWIDRPGGTWGRNIPAPETPPRHWFLEYNEVPGTEVVGRVSVDRWLPYTPGQILALKATEPPEPALESDDR